jgi:hypothetical protein
VTCTWLVWWLVQSPPQAFKPVEEPSWKPAHLEEHSQRSEAWGPGVTQRRLWHCAVESCESDPGTEVPLAFHVDLVASCLRLLRFGLPALLLLLLRLLLLLGLLLLLLRLLRLFLLLFLGLFSR